MKEGQRGQAGTEKSKSGKGWLMQEFEQLGEMVERGMANIIEFWPVKAVCAALGGVFCWLFDGTGVIFAVVVGLVFLDTLTKWAAITRRFLIDRGAAPDRVTLFAIIYAFPSAWQKGYLESHTLRKCWGDKLFTYLILVIAAGMVAKLPDINLFGAAINSSIIGGIYACIAVTELFSITENFAEMENHAMSRFRTILIMLSDKITGGNFSVTMTAKTDDTEKAGGAENEK